MWSDCIYWLSVSLYPKHKCGHVHISNLSVSCHVLCAGQRTEPPPPRIPPSCFPRKSPSSPRRAVTQGKPFSTTHDCPWSSAAVTQERPDRLSFLSAASHYTHHRSSDHATAVMQSRVLCVVPAKTPQMDRGMQRRDKWMGGGRGGESSVGSCHFPRGKVSSR